VGTTTATVLQVIFVWPKSVELWMDSPLTEHLIKQRTYNSQTKPEVELAAVAFHFFRFCTSASILSAALFWNSRF
jgi:hypothetical protein